MIDKRTPFETMISMVQSVSFLAMAQSQEMGAAKRVNAIEVWDDRAREWALVGLTLINR